VIALKVFLFLFLFCTDENKKHGCVVSQKTDSQKTPKKHVDIRYKGRMFDLHVLKYPNRQKQKIPSEQNKKNTKQYR
jgi:hypothetical protein